MFSVIVGHITHSYYPNIGGIENYIRRLKFFLEKKGYEVNVYTTDWRVKKIPKEKNTFYFKTNFTIFRNPISLEMLRSLRKSNDDIYHFHAPWFLINALSNFAIKNKPKVLTLHGIQLHGPFGVFLTNTFYYPFAKNLMKSSNLIIAQAINEVLILTKHFNIPKEKIRIIPNGIEIEKFKRPKRSLLRKFIEKYGLKEDSFKLLFVSRLVPHKNPDKLIKALEFVKDENLEVVIIGEESNLNYSRYLRKLANDSRIHILGKVNFDELVCAYHVCNAFAFLSIWDAMSAVVLEAMACGLPIISTRTGCIPFVVKNYENGLFVDSTHPKEIASKISELMNMGNKYLKEMGKSNKEKIKKNYNWIDKAEEILQVYEELIKH